MPGSCRSARATFVADAMATTVTWPGNSFAFSTMKSAAVLPSTATRVGFGWFVFPKPSSPWTKSAMRSFSAPTMLVKDPSTTGMSGRPNFSIRYSAFCVAILVRTFPNSDVIPMTSTSGLRSAKHMAHVSSTPGSVSIISFRTPGLPSVVRNIPAADARAPDASRLYGKMMDKGIPQKTRQVAFRKLRASLPVWIVRRIGKSEIGTSTGSLTPPSSDGHCTTRSRESQRHIGRIWL